MKMLKIGVAFAALLATAAPIAANAATAHNIVLVPGAFTDKSSWDKVARRLRAKGFKVTEVPISHHPRLTGTTKYKFGSRVIRAFVDLLAVRWMKNRYIHYTAKDLTAESPGGAAATSEVGKSTAGLVS